VDVPSLPERVGYVAQRKYKGFFDGSERGLWHALTLPILLLLPLAALVAGVLLRLASRTGALRRTLRWTASGYLLLGVFLGYYFRQATLYL